MPSKKQEMKKHKQAARREIRIQVEGERNNVFLHAMSKRPRLIPTKAWRWLIQYLLFPKKDGKKKTQE